MSVYLDFNSSNPIDERVLELMMSVYRNTYGNADSRTHDFGDRARKTVEEARVQVATLLGVSNDEVFFTSGATESNNIAIQGIKEYGIRTEKKHIITTAIEHKAIIESVKYMEREGFSVDFIRPDSSGRIEASQILDKVREDTLLVSVMHVNNETGVIQPVEEIGNVLHERNVLFHVDATQSFGKLVDEIKGMKYDMLSMSAHKIGGPQGVGALILKRKNYKLPPIHSIMYGGQQERGLRPGTVPVALVAGLGKACKLANDEYKQNNATCETIKEKIISLLDNSNLNYRINGNLRYTIGNTINIYIEGVASEALMLATKDYCGISNGSACNSKSYKPSYVLEAMGIPAAEIENSIRISWGASIDINQLELMFGKMIEIAEQLVW